ncbi:hypothetical protein LZ31DRAFT_20113 [Colletotrichum somersetense]|nr:hypothetical protein LZ31DRAFT_20113 [Colletotrichum somersetense]
MVVEIGSLDRSTFEPFRIWHLEDSACEDDGPIDIETGLFPPLALNKCSTKDIDGLLNASCRPVPTPSGNYSLECHSEAFTSASVGEAEANRQPDSLLQTPQTPRFVISANHGHPSFVFSRQPPSPRVEKRQRAKSDIDGPHTAALSCKKRRLRLHLITSRLSQPFSLPATHIINREAIASGDKRFVRMAAVVTFPDVGKQGLGREGSIMLRAAVLNRVRIRVRNEARLRGDLTVAVAAENAAVLYHGQQLATGARFVAQSSALAEQRQQTTAARVVLMRSGTSSSISNPTNSLMASSRTPQSSRILPKSPRLRPARSPVLAPSGAMLEDMEDDGLLAFPAADHDCCYAWAEDDDLEDVYSDFGAIFGGASNSGEMEDDGHSYEEYLDELDGISWVGGR